MKLHDLSLVPPLRTVGCLLLAMGAVGPFQVLGWAPTAEKLLLMVVVGMLLLLLAWRRKRKNLCHLVHCERQDPRLYMSAVALAKMIRAKETSVVDVVELFIAQVIVY